MEDRVYVIKRNDGWYMSNFDDDDIDNKKIYWTEKLRDADFYSAKMIIEADYKDLPEKERKQSRIVEVKLFENSLNPLFKVGDKVVTSMGKEGVITSICDCEMCQQRGFLESNVRYEDGEYGIIDIVDFENNFDDYYSIGDKVYGNILADITILKDYIKRQQFSINETKKQIKLIQKLKGEKE